MTSAFIANVATPDDETTLIAGSLVGAPDTTYRVELFSNPKADVYGYGQGQNFLDFVDVTTGSDGTAIFGDNIDTIVPVGQFISATATDPAGNTSEFASDIIVAYTPDQVRAAYGLPPIENLPASWSGAGQTIAIVIPYDDPNLVGDVQAFDTRFSISQFGSGGPSLNILNQAGQSTPLPDDDDTGSWADEEAMDVEWAHAMAPGTNIDVVEANSSAPTDILAAISCANGLKGVSVVSMSFGIFGGGTYEEPYEVSYDQPYFSTAGITYVAATGDFGAGNLFYPAASPNVLAVGGTTLTLDADGSYVGEDGWIESGGGRSLYEPQPSYQASVVPVSMSTIQGVANRTVPDVSFDADELTGVAEANSFEGTKVNTQGATWDIGDGTSLGAPCWAGLIAIVNQGRSSPLDSRDPTQTLRALYTRGSQRGFQRHFRQWLRPRDGPGHTAGQTPGALPDQVRCDPVEHDHDRHHFG